ncbi:cupredoxin domain-containing protein [Sphingomonas nostoxanthinifaciens]|uniref:cupredoxin domain-containing protein n=1 Tax=Sphingomonas nostoxanthinifaciens TaxID=2872652 RepID=UPI001CC1DBF1|nr:cupredoxin domain-containing protein [Sphingomonas nostoxanthinifaciens]UAK23012.1 cupredoxin domain-containing protein [Sphingomonas nostoxanthinifaciens]
MKILMLALGAATLAMPAMAQTIDWKTAGHVEIAMTNHGFTPRKIVLDPGAPYIVRVVNPSDRTHNLVAKEFFAATRVDPRDRAVVDMDNLKLAPGEHVTIHLITPKTHGARYPFHSSQIVDAASDLDGNFFIR